jgi:outer membrane protein
MSAPTRLAAGALFAFAALAPAGAQQTAPPPSQAPSAPALPTASNAAGPALSLEEAVETARRNNPSYLITENGRRRAQAAVLGANGQLLPSVNVGLGSGFREGRTQFFAGQAFGNTAGTLSSNWSPTRALTTASASSANRRAARAERRGGERRGSAARRRRCAPT